LRIIRVVIGVLPGMAGYRGIIAWVVAAEVSAWSSHRPIVEGAFQLIAGQAA